uniref:ditrans,polycis-polyprenyl diphosphate synthase [(2E,6E)-farnesyldiphosphate specific] n=1 Tax=Ditylenchus dipsaci TaxID=166011 RepID=A0A915DVM8_9BILA
MRGDLVSRPVGSVLEEAAALKRAGVKEILVISQDTSAYGVDTKYKLDFWNGQPVKTKFFDMCEALGQLWVSQAKLKKISNIARWLVEAELDRVGCFTYSPVEGATANDLPDHVPEEIKQERYERFMQVQQQISAAKLQKRIGQTMTVLVDSLEDEYPVAVARSYADAPEIDGNVFVEDIDKSTIQPGDMLEVEITDADEYDLFAKLIKIKRASGYRCCGGNLYRGSQLQKDGLVGRVTGDQMGMLATVMNGLAMRDALVRRNIRTRLMSALPIGTVVESYSSRDAIRHLSQGEVCVFVAGDIKALLKEKEISEDDERRAAKRSRIDEGLNFMTDSEEYHLPKHVAIIMDGNNRFAKKNQMQKGIRALTVFAFSSENWNRPQFEVDLLMKLLEETIHEQIPRMKKFNIALRFIGDRSRLPSHLVALMEDAEQQTAHHNTMTLTIAEQLNTRVVRLPNSPAATAQLQVGDKIIAVDGKETQNFEKLNFALIDRVGETGSLNIDVDRADVLGFSPYRPVIPAVVTELTADGAAIRQGIKVGDLLMCCVMVNSFILQVMPQGKRDNMGNNSKTADEVLRREMRQMEGALASNEKIDLSKVRLERTGFFKTVDIKPARIPNSPDQSDLNVNVEEQHSGTTNISAGYGSVRVIDNSTLGPKYASVNLQKPSKMTFSEEVGGNALVQFVLNLALPLPFKGDWTRHVRPVIFAEVVKYLY